MLNIGDAVTFATEPGVRGQVIGHAPDYINAAGRTYTTLRVLWSNGAVMTHFAVNLRKA